VASAKVLAAGAARLVAPEVGLGVDDARADGLDTSDPGGANSIRDREIERLAVSWCVFGLGCTTAARAWEVVAAVMRVDAGAAARTTGAGVVARPRLANARCGAVVPR
jgi:hypothetical protein